MNTRIFNVEYFYMQEFDGKADKDNIIKENQNVVAKNAEEAIGKVRLEVIKPYTYFDDDSKKKVKVTHSHFDPVEVTLEAEA